MQRVIHTWLIVCGVGMCRRTEPYEGDRTAKAIYDFAVAHIPSFVSSVTAGSLQSFVGMCVFRVLRVHAIMQMYI